MNIDAATAMLETFRVYRRRQWLEHCGRHVLRNRRLASFRAFRDGGLEITEAGGLGRAANLALWDEVCREGVTDDANDRADDQAQRGDRV